MNKKLSLISWGLYDFANTIYSAIVLTSYFPLYLTSIAGANWYLGFATTTSMILAGLVVPFLGAVSDKTGKSKEYLVLATIGCIAFLIPIAFLKGAAPLIAVFLVSCFFYHASLVFYNALMTDIASEEEQGFASGLGTGLGYLGVVFALPAAHWADEHWGRPSVFLVAAVFFLLFSIPLFLFVKNRGAQNAGALRPGLFFDEWRGVIKTFRALPGDPAMLIFLLGNFLVVDALNSTIFWISVYVREVFHPPQAGLIQFLVRLNVFAFLAGIACGFLTDKLGSARIFLISCAALTLTLIVLYLVPDFKGFSIACLSGGAFAISGIWTAGRKVLIDIAPPERIGEFFGIYGLTTKISVITSLLFSLAADLAGFRPALWVLILPSAAGTFLVWRFCLILQRRD